MYVQYVCILTKVNMNVNMYFIATSQQACWCLHPAGQNVDGIEPIVLKMYMYM